MHQITSSLRAAFLTRDFDFFAMLDTSCFGLAISEG